MTYQDNRNPCLILLILVFSLSNSTALYKKESANFVERFSGTNLPCFPMEDHNLSRQLSINCVAQILTFKHACKLSGSVLPLIISETICSDQLIPNPPTALCVRLNRKWELGIFTKMSTSPLIFLRLNYFRHYYLEIVLCSVSLLMHIWVQVEHSLLCRQIYT